MCIGLLKKKKSASLGSSAQTQSWGLALDSEHAPHLMPCGFGLFPVTRSFQELGHHQISSL
jgi:hypothetical protein